MNWQEYEKKLPPLYSKEELAVIKRAFELASEIHKDERRLTGGLYIDHPVAVSLEAAKLQLDFRSIATALLHDVYETDTGALKKIKKHFDSDIVFLVKGLTKVGKTKYYGVERTAESTRKMFMAMAQDIRVIMIKLLDRLDNLGTLYILPEEKQKRIAIESLDIYAPVADRLGMSNIKLQIEDRAFKYAYPKEYEWVIKETKEKIPEREKHLKKVIPILKNELDKENIIVKSIHSRAKSYYSLWKKLLRNNMDWYSIYDLAAVRIVVGSLEDCYSLLGVIHKLWSPLPGRIKDYIALPKQNGYKSLHTTVFCLNKKITEFQIRTKKMHDEAEQGIAAHWAWELAGKPKEIKSMPHKKFSWIKQLQEWHKDFDKNAGGDKFLETLKIDFFKDRVFVLTPEGDIIDLPEGATPVDFAYQIHSDIGNSIVAAKINNHIVPLSYELASGDMVEILSQKNKKPNLKMLDYAKTSVAKNYIKSHLKKSGLLAQKNEERRGMKAELNIYSDGRNDLMKDISLVLSEFRINIGSLIKRPEEEGHIIVYAAFSPKNKDQVRRIVTRLKTVKGVGEIETKVK